MKPITIFVCLLAFAGQAYAQSIPCTRTYTTDADFDEGEWFSVNHNAPFNDQLQLDPQIDRITPLPFLWVACSQRGTVVRIDVNTGEVMGEYRTTPEGYSRNPSRTTVDHNGNCWVTNREDYLLINGIDHGSTCKFGVVIGGTRCDNNGIASQDGEYLKPPFQYCTAVDRNGDGLIHTSRGLGNILDWPDSTDGSGGVTALVEDAEDECILVYQRLPQATRTRHCSVDQENNVWVSGYPAILLLKLRNSDGFILDSANVRACSRGAGYGGLVDKNGVIWSANSLLWYDPSVDSCANIPQSAYGLGMDPVTGDIWCTSGDNVIRIDPHGNMYPGYPKVCGGAFPSGIVVTNKREVWTANRNSNNVSHLDSNGNWIDRIPVGESPTGVAVDANGRIWVTNMRSNSAMRIDPDAHRVDMTVDLGPGAGPYNYSDMTGAVAFAARSYRHGTWTIVKKACIYDSTWGYFQWNADEPAGTRIQVEARVAGTLLWKDITLYNGIPLCGTAMEMEGPAIEVRVTFYGKVDSTISPILYDLRIEQCNYLLCDIAVPPSIAPKVSPGGGFVDTSFNIAAHIENPGTQAFEYDRAELELPEGMGVSPALGTSLRTPPGVIPAHSFDVFNFALVVTPKPYRRTVHLRVVLYDTQNRPVKWCDAEVFIEGTERTSCSVDGPKCIVYYEQTNTAIPATFNISTIVENLYDSTLSRISCIIDTSSTHVLRLVGSQSMERRSSKIHPGIKWPFTWSFTVKKPVVASTVDTVDFHYFVFPDSLAYTCTYIVPIVFMPDTTVLDTRCAITAPAAISADRYAYSPNPFSLDYTLTNSGNVPLAVEVLEILLPSYITTIDPLTKTVSPLAPSGQHNITWPLTALTSSYEREAVITVVAKDAEGNVLSMCEHRVFLPGVDAITCETSGDVSLVFDDILNDYTPNPFDNTVTVYNHLDSAQTNVEVEAVSSSNVINLNGMASVQTRSDIPANDSWAINWQYIATVIDTTSVVTVTYRIRSDQYPAWSALGECSFDVIIPPRRYTYCADCIADGIDTVWINQTNEIIVPIPFQVYTAVVNNCTGALTDVRCSINFPSRLSLAPGETLVKTIDRIVPGDTAYVSWNLAATSAVADESVSVQVSITANELSAPSTCVHRVHLVHTSDIQLAVSKKLLYFQAVRNASLPQGQDVTVYAGYPTEMPWTAQYPAWLDVAPASSTTAETQTVQPNTTAFPIGRYWGDIAYSSAHPNAPKTVNVIYDITDGTVGISQPPSSAHGITLHQNYPNPFASSTTISYTTETDQPITVTIYNTLGVPVRAVQQEAVTGNNTIQLSGLPPGLYMVVVRGGNGAAVRRMVGR